MVGGSNPLVPTNSYIVALILLTNDDGIDAEGLSILEECVKDLADIVVDTCAPLEDASVTLKNHQDKIGPVSTMAFITCVWMSITTVAEILADRGVKLYIHPSHNVPGNEGARTRLDEALTEYKRRIAGV